MGTLSLAAIFSVVWAAATVARRIRRRRHPSDRPHCVSPSASSEIGFRSSAVGEEEEEKVVVMVMVEEEVQGTEVVMKDRVGVEVGTEADDSCVGVGRCFLQFPQGLLSTSTSLRRHLARARACGTDVDAGSTILLVSWSTSSRAVEAGHLVAAHAPPPGGGPCSDSLHCCCSRARYDGGELRGDEVGGHCAQDWTVRCVRPGW